MPLVIVCGPPLSGKTTRSKQLIEHFTTTKPSLPIHLINEESLHLEKSVVYSNSNEEKKARSVLFGAVERHLSKNTLVILDSLNYIKGFRYQAYCIARAIGTLHCVLYCSGNLEQSLQRNRTSEWYLEEQINELCMRFEEPDPFARWDKPLFRCNPADTALAFSAISSALFDGQAPPPNLSTVVKPVCDDTYLQQLDSITKYIIDQIAVWLQKGNVVGSVTVFTDSTKNASAILAVKKRISQNELFRLQKHFILINKVHNLPTSAIACSFLDYLKSNLNL